MHKDKKPEPTDFIPQNALERLLLLAARNEIGIDEFYSEFLASGVFVLGEAEPSVEQESDQLYLNTYEIYGIAVNAQPTVPIFTSEPRLYEYIESPQTYFEIKGKDLVAIMEPETAIIMNPASACGKEFTPTEIQKLASYH